MFEVKGILEFDPINVSKKHQSQSWKRIAMVKFDCDLDKYYSWLLENRFNLKLNRPLRGPHITIISDIIDNNMWNEARNIFHNREITLKYNTDIRSNSEHWWLKVICEDGDNIRTAMCLGKPYYDYHLTIGYANGKNIEHSKYILEQCKKFNL